MLKDNDCRTTIIYLEKVSFNNKSDIEKLRGLRHKKNFTTGNKRTCFNWKNETIRKLGDER